MRECLTVIQNVYLGRARRPRIDGGTKPVSHWEVTTCFKTHLGTGALSAKPLYAPTGRSSAVFARIRVPDRRKERHDQSVAIPSVGHAGLRWRRRDRAARG